MSSLFTSLPAFADPRGRLTRAGYAMHLVAGGAVIAATFLVMASVGVAAASLAGYPLVFGLIPASGVAGLLGFALVLSATLKRCRDIGAATSHVSVFLIASIAAGRADIFEQAYAGIAVSYALVYLLVPSGLMRLDGSGIS